MDGLRQEVNDVREARDVSVTVRNENRLADLKCVEGTVAKVFSSYLDSFRYGSERVLSSKIAARIVSEGPVDGSVEYLAVKRVNVNSPAEKSAK